MKKILSLILALAFMLCMTLSANGLSADAPISEIIVSQTTEYLDDGSVLTVTITEEISDVMLLSDTYVRSGTKTYTLKDADGNEQWWFKLRGQYNVTTGVSAVCTVSSYTHSIMETRWSLDSASTSKSGNKAMGEATFKKKTLFIVTETKDISLTLTCDTNGNLS